MVWLRTRLGPPQCRPVTHDEWVELRQNLAAAAKGIGLPREDLSRKRSKLPWERVQKNYTFEGPDGRETLSGLFAGKSQLIIYHFMLVPDRGAWLRGGSPHVSSARVIDIHLKRHDTTLVAVSRARYETLTAHKRRMGWTFKWVSSFGTDFNLDFHVSFTPEHVTGDAISKRQIAQPWAPETVGVSVFRKDDGGDVYHMYSCYSRGSEMLTGAHHYLGLATNRHDEPAEGPGSPSPAQRLDGRADERLTVD